MKNAPQWGIIYLEAGVPNKIDVCPDCKGIDGSVDFVTWAQEIATLAHAGQYRRDRHGTPTNEAYIRHCRRVAERFEDWPAAAARLHDAMEDHPDKVDRTKLEAAGVPQSVIRAVEVLTKKKGVTYEDYLDEVWGNKIARAVKVWDMIDNLASDPTDTQIRKYAQGLVVLVM